MFFEVQVLSLLTNREGESIKISSKVRTFVWHVFCSNFLLMWRIRRL